MNLELCSKCQNMLPDSEFGYTVRRGKSKRASYCKECQRAYAREHYSNNKKMYKTKARARNLRIIAEYRVWQLEYFKNHPCVDCGETDPIVLQFDHVRGLKVANISRMVRDCFGKQTFLDEVAKCEIRCANCHTRRTAATFNWWSTLL
jgi:methionyl-tRNA synthetase